VYKKIASIRKERIAKFCSLIVNDEKIILKNKFHRWRALLKRNRRTNIIEQLTELFKV
jgi:hypothetical protein